ncbi:MAG: hypothetical protein IPM37_07570 [Hahellaceae bacterium]|jgi:hypothetical protein|nr:hypothetical protein [Hahellaceae bacterium]MBK8971224.1 hypothetical protein [Hahellaceae bacterium]
MRFLCLNHYEQMERESEQKLSEHAVRWLCLANCHRQQGRQTTALNYCGCAFESASLIVSQYPEGDGYGPTLIALTAVCLAHQFRQLGKNTSAEEVIDLGCHRLSGFRQRESSSWMFSLKVLTQPSLWSDFCEYHLGFRLDRLDAETGCGHVRVVH